MTDDREVMVLGRGLDESGTPTDEYLGLSRTVLNRHLLIAGTTGSGKSTTATTAIRTGSEATDGATIVIDPKGDGWPREIARTIYERDGDLQNLLYFDTTSFVPALAPLDIRPDLRADRARDRAIETVIEHTIETIQQVRQDATMATRSMDALRYLLRALYDPQYGANAVGISDLLDAIAAFGDGGAELRTSTEATTALLESLRATTAGQQQAILGGVRSRAEKIYGNRRLRTVFDHQPANPDDAFRFDAHLNTDRIIVIDLGGLSARNTRVFTTLLLGTLWRALKRRQHRNTDPGQVLLFLDEAASLGVEPLLESLLAQGRGFDLGVVPIVQFPDQLGTDANAELLNNIQSLLVGRVPADPGLTRRLATARTPQAQLDKLLTTLPDTRWLFKPASDRETDPYDPQQIAEVPLPPGHPDRADPGIDPTAFDRAFEACQERTREQYGLVPEPTGATTPNPTQPAIDRPPAMQALVRGTTLPLLESLPGPIRPEETAIVCTDCATPYAPTADGLCTALTCHGDPEAIDRAALPPLSLGESVPPDRVRAAPVDPAGYLTLTLVARVHRFAVDCRLLDPVHDPLGPVFETLGCPETLRAELAEAGYLRRGRIGEYVYPTLTPDGRELIGHEHTHGEAWGPGEGDLTETLLHRVLVEALARDIARRYEDLDRVVRYYEPDAEDLPPNTRLDVVGLTDGSITVIGEAECANNDAAVAARRDYDAITTIDPEAAVWAVPSNSRGHAAVLQPLGTATDADIADPSARIRSYSKSSRISQLSPDAPGLTEIHTLHTLRERLPTPTLD